MYEPRLYREDMNRDRFRFFQSTCYESDLFIGVPYGQYNRKMIKLAGGELVRLRRLILDHISRYPSFGTSLEPLFYPDTNLSGTGPETFPDEILTMLQCSNRTGTGPMSSVAGVFAENVAFRLIREFELKEIVIENGGDLFIKNQEEVISVIHAGSSPLSNKLAFVIEPGTWGVCTSSGTTGHSFSKGRADAVTVIAKKAPVADAWATSLANDVKEPGDIEQVLERVREIDEIIGCAIIIGKSIGIRGEIEVKPLS